jgi:hypothetical protein
VGWGNGVLHVPAEIAAGQGDRAGFEDGADFNSFAAAIVGYAWRVRDMREVMREKTAQAEVLYNLLAGTATEGFKSNFYGQRHVALELIVSMAWCTFLRRCRWRW